MNRENRESLERAKVLARLMVAEMASYTLDIRIAMLSALIRHFQPEVKELNRRIAELN